VEELKRRAGEFIEYSRRVGSVLTGPMALHLLADAARLGGDSSGALEIYEQALAKARTSAEGALLQTVHVTIQTGLALAAIAVGNTDRGREALDEVETLIKGKPDLEGSQPEVDIDRVDAWLSLEGLAARPRVEARLAAVLEQARERGFRAHEPFVLVQRARLRHLLGDDAAARADLEEARRLFASFGANARVEALDRLLAG
jgi:tetratricopeptide (TPR) repeat protein